MTSIAIGVTHQWAERLPLRDNMLICISCNQIKAIGQPDAGTLPCAELAAWQHYGATARGDYVVFPPRNPVTGQPMTVREQFESECG